MITVGPFDTIVWNILRECETLKIGHFVFTAGGHSDTYVEKVEATDDPAARWALADMLQEAIREHLPNFIMNDGTIVGTPMGAISLATTLSDQTSCQLAFLEKKGDELVLRGANLKRVKDHDVFLVEDIVTSGKTTTKALDVLNEADGNVIGMSCIANRQGWTPPESLELFVQLAVKPPDIDLVSWPAEKCHLCKELRETKGESGTPINIDCGHGADFLAAIKDDNLRDELAGKFLLG